MSINHVLNYLHSISILHTTKDFIGNQPVIADRSKRKMPSV